MEGVRVVAIKNSDLDVKSEVLLDIQVKISSGNLDIWNRMQNADIWAECINFGVISTRARRDHLGEYKHKKRKISSCGELHHLKARKLVVSKLLESYSFICKKKKK